jgi:hypothetical protein
MTWKELYPYVWALENLGYILHDKILVGIIDNLAGMFTNNTRRSRSHLTQQFMFRIARAMRRYNIECLLEWQYREYLHAVDFWTRGC